MRDRVAAELLDLLVAEELTTVCTETAGRLRARLGDGRRVEAGGRRDVTGRWRTTPPVLLDGRLCHPGELIDPSGGPEVREALACAVDHGAWAEHRRGAVVDRLAADRSRAAWEAMASLRDRPGHPAAKARLGWSAAELDRYAPEAGASFWLRWAAVARDRVRGGPAGDDPSALVCTAPERRQLEASLEELGGDLSTHLLLPVHPAHIDAAAATAPLLPPAVRVLPTASARTVLPVQRPGVALKLPLAVNTLAAERLLPPRYCANAAVGQSLLQRAFGRTAAPVPVHVADERRWWVVDEGGGLTDDRGVLGCVVRVEPALEELIPLGALADPDALAVLYGSDADRRLTMLTEVATAVAGTALAAAAAGLAPELHGQNVLLHVHDGRVQGVVLRDHDAVRFHPPWLRAAGLPEPVLALSPASPNTLVNTSPEDLLAWFQTLAVDVALRGVADGVAAERPDLEHAAWHAIDVGLRQALTAVAAPPSVTRAVARVLDAPSWPLKQVLRPWLVRGNSGSSMPSAFGRQPNPLRGAHPGKRSA